MNTIEIINNLLSAKGIKPSKMMKDLGFSSGLFSQWKAGAQNPSTEKLAKIAEYLGVTTDYLLGKSNIKADTTLSAEERELLDMFGELTEVQMASVMERIRTFIEINEAEVKKDDVG